MILFSASRPGGAATLLPVYKELRKRDKIVTFYANEHAAQLLESNFCSFERTADSLGSAQVLSILQNVRPEIVVTGLLGDSGKNLDKNIIKYAKSKGIRTIAVLDSWMNLEDRLFDEVTGDPLGYLPDIIAVMEELVRKDLINIGVPEEKIVITGQPVFDTILQPDPPVYSDAITIVFFSEPIRELGMKTPFDQHDALKMLISSCRRLDRKVRIILKPHPVMEIPPEVFQEANVSLEICRDSDTDSLICSADFVAGISSTLLIKAFVAGKKVLLTHPGITCSLKTSILSRGGYLEPSSSPEMLLEHLTGRSNVLNEHFPFTGQGVNNVIKLIESQIKGEHYAW